MGHHPFLSCLWLHSQSLEQCLAQKKKKKNVFFFLFMYMSVYLSIYLCEWHWVELEDYGVSSQTLKNNFRKSKWKYILKYSKRIHNRKNKIKKTLFSVWNPISRTQITNKKILLSLYNPSKASKQSETKYTGKYMIFF